MISRFLALRASLACSLVSLVDRLGMVFLWSTRGSEAGFRRDGLMCRYTGVDNG
jgi:hypothetical protein